MIKERGSSGRTLIGTTQYGRDGAVHGEVVRLSHKRSTNSLMRSVHIETDNAQHRHSEHRRHSTTRQAYSTKAYCRLRILIRRRPEKFQQTGVLGHGNKTFYASFTHYAMGDGRMPEQVEQYRLNAEKCLELAQTFNDLEAKRTMLAMADAWLMLAAQRVKNVETVDMLFGLMEAEG